jgi:hypothetical protein
MPPPVQSFLDRLRTAPALVAAALMQVVTLLQVFGITHWTGDQVAAVMGVEAAVFGLVLHFVGATPAGAPPGDR